MKKTLDLPDELNELMIEYKACLDCRDECISSVFKAKRAIYYGKEAEKARLSFWRQVSELYPEVREVLSYSFDDCNIFYEEDIK